MSKKEEEWRNIKILNNKYYISNLGRVKSSDSFISRRGSTPFFKKGIILKTYVNKKNGYSYVYLRSPEKGINIRVHKLVAEYFIPKIDGKNCIDHIDGNKLNNFHTNLRWCTNKENSNFETSKVNLKKAIKNTRSKHLYKEVIIINNATKKCIEFNNVHETAEYLNTTNSVILDCIKGIRGTRKGYKIYFKEMRNKKNIIEWAKSKGILDKSTPVKQHEKTQEEVDELKKAIEENDIDEIIDAIGDIIVTLVIQAELNGLDIEDCIESAYNVIKNRTGKMVDGIFVKDK